MISFVVYMVRNSLWTESEITTRSFSQVLQVNLNSELRKNYLVQGPI